MSARPKQPVARAPASVSKRGFRHDFAAPDDVEAWLQDQIKAGRTTIQALVIDALRFRMSGQAMPESQVAERLRALEENQQKTRAALQVLAEIASSGNRAEFNAALKRKLTE